MSKERKYSDKTELVASIIFLIVILISIIFIFCIYLKSVEQSVERDEKFLKQVILKEYKVQNKNISKEKLDRIFNEADFRKLREVVNISEELPLRYSFEIKKYKENFNYKAYKELLEPIGYKIIMNDSYIRESRIIHRTSDGLPITRETDEETYIIEIIKNESE